MKNTHFFGRSIFSPASFVDRSEYNVQRGFYKPIGSLLQKLWYLAAFGYEVTLFYWRAHLSSGSVYGSFGLAKQAHPYLDSKAPRRCTISDGNNQRPGELFRELYLSLFEKYRGLLPDSRLKIEVIQKLFIVASTVISLFKDILKVAGRPRKDGHGKGGIKAHVIIHAAELMPCLVRFTEGSRHDDTFLKYLNLLEGSYMVIDKGYTDYHQYAQRMKWNIFYLPNENQCPVCKPGRNRPASGQRP